MSASLHLAHYLQNLQRFGIRPGLERVHALLARAGNSQHEYPVVLVGGTNGKGSTAEFLARLLQQDGRKVGLYTSPHLYEWNERIRILETGAVEHDALKHHTFERETESLRPLLFPGEISGDALDALFADALPHIEAVANSEWGQPTEFEVLTFLGLWHFARQKVDVAIVEVGLGGKWDATNTTEPIVSIITHVALDHCDRLGNTLEEIASDKVEIARPGRVLVTAETKPEVLNVFEAHCRKIGCRLQVVEVRREGDFQQINFQTAKTAHRVLCESLHWTFNSEASLQKLAVTGRFETIQEKPRVILDGANNPDGAQILAEQLRSTLATAPGAKLILVLGILQDKDWAAMTEVLAPLAHIVIATQSPSPRAASVEQVAKEAQKFCSQVEARPSVQAAFERALELADENDILCVTGSFYTIAEVERAAPDGAANAL